MSRSLKALAPALGALALMTLWPGAVHAGDDEKADDGPSSYWHMSFLGGVVQPLRGMKQTHEQGLVVGGRLGWTSKIGLGLDVAGTYSPLPRGNLMELETYEIHYATGTIGPRMTVGRGTFRVWVAGGGGLAFEQARRFIRTVPTGRLSRETAPAASAAAGLELHLMSSGGLSLTTSYTRTFSDELRYEYLDVKGGLVFAF